MADVGSLGHYKVVVTADYTQLKAQFEQINQIVSTTAKTITDTLTATSNAVNNSMANSFKAMAQSITTSMKEAQNAMNGFGTEAKTVGQGLEQISKGAGKAGEGVAKSGRSARAGSEGFKAYAAQVREAEKAEQRFRAQQGKAILAAEQRDIAGRTAQHKAAWQEIVRQEREQQAQQARQQQRIRQLSTQYRVAYEEINKYMLSHAKMSEAVFIRLQGRISALGREIQRLGGTTPMANPLAGMNYNQYASQFSKWNDFFTSFKHHMTWMASARAMGTAFAIPAKTISTIAEVEKQMAQMKQVNEEVKDNQEVLNKTTQDYIGIAQQYGASVNEVIKAGVLWGRAYKDLNTVMKLTTLSTKLSVADNMDIGLANRAVESVINGYQKQGQAIQFATHVVDSWTKVAHNAQSSATDLAEALSRTGAAAKAVGVDFDTTTALASTMIKATGRSGAEVGRMIAA